MKKFAKGALIGLGIYILSLAITYLAGLPIFLGYGWVIGLVLIGGIISIVISK
ncbi:MAG TPA: hypothetical protein VFA93_02910 [Patescibacteria group bacterium]|nr:hypothetical protein [Patescibacteria group bacterium]